MLQDFLSLEQYFEAPECALFFEDLSRRYGVEAVLAMLERGYLRGYAACCRSAAGGGTKLWLTPAGRAQAAKFHG